MLAEDFVPEWRKLEDERDFVYFIQAGEDGPIKIGVARNPEVRMAHLQVANAVELRLLGAHQGSFQAEYWAHAHFRADRIRGEWFSPSRALLRCAVTGDVIKARRRAIKNGPPSFKGICERCMKPLTLPERESRYMICVPCQAAVELDEAA